MHFFCIFWILTNLFEIFWNFAIAKSKFLKFREILWNSGKFPWKSERKMTKFCKICKNLENSTNFCEKLKNLEKFEFVAVQRFANLVDLEKCWNISIWSLHYWLKIDHWKFWILQNSNFLRWNRRGTPRRPLRIQLCSKRW